MTPQSVRQEREDSALRSPLLSIALLGMVFCPGLAVMLTIHTQRSHGGVPIYDGLLEGWLLAPVLLPLTFLLVWRRPGNPITWAIVGLGVLGGLQQLSGSYAAEALLVQDRRLAGGVAAQFGYSLFQQWWVFGMILLLALFPTGRPLSPRWNWLLWGLAVLFVVSPIAELLLPPYPFIETESPQVIERIPSPLPWSVPDIVVRVAKLLVALTAVLILVSVPASIFARFRRSRGVERQQLKWFFYAVVATTVFFVVTAGEQVADVDLPGPLEQLLNPWAVGPAIIMGSIALAILRYRLYDIDLVINRTLVYGSLTALLVLVYVAGVVGVPSLVPLAEDNDLVVAGSTLAVAALFSPLRRGIQGFVDRRFYRGRYDAVRTVEAFSARLRDQVDLETLQTDLVGLVRQTLQPAHVSVWLRESPRRLLS